MGMVSFFKEAGEKLFGHKPEISAAVAEPSSEEKAAAANAAASDAIKMYIRAQDLPADDLTITFNGDRRWFGGEPRSARKNRGLLWQRSWGGRRC